MDDEFVGKLVVVILNLVDKAWKAEDSSGALEFSQSAETIFDILVGYIGIRDKLK